MKSVWRLGDPLLNHLVTLTPDDFEVVAGAAVALSGGEQMRVLCTGDEGGIDFYGRLAIRPPSPRVDAGILYTTIVPARLLVLGQAKRFSRDAMIGRPEIQKFKGQIDDCLDKYDENPLPPTHRVPGSFYIRGEPCLGIFVTTASFTETAAGAVAASGVVLVSGVQLAQFLLMHNVGVVKEYGAPAFRTEAFAAWLASERQRLVG